MKTSQNLALVAVCAILFQTQITAPAQNMFQFIFRGTCIQTNRSGDFTTIPMTHQTLLNSAVQAGGVDSGPLMLVYHINGSSFGDTVDIINASTGAVLSTVFGFYFGESFGRQAITNAAGTIVKRLDYIYTSQNDHSLGDALVTKAYASTSKSFLPGASSRISGTMNWVVESTVTSGSKICNGTFSVGRELFFTNSQ